MHAETLIIGGGLAGLNLARALRLQGRSALLIEARARLGGRILSESHGGGAFDLGPAWFWPGQPRIAALTTSLGLRRFEQFSKGASVFEDETGAVEHGYGIASMRGSYRLAGGLSALIEVLAREAPAEDGLRLNCAAHALRRTPDGVLAQTEQGEITARRAVLALPPRLAAASISFSPALPSAVLQAMSATPTWMAGHAKAVAVYPRAFWREAGLSGDAMSRQGPLAEIHDASAAPSGPFALFGFIGAPPAHRTDAPALRRHVLEQLTRLFGPQAATPSALFLKDWAFDPQTAVPLDRQALYAHPSYGDIDVASDIWRDTLLLGGSEVASTFGGYLEGALEASDAALRRITAE